MNKKEIKELLMQKQMGRCIADGCPYDVRILGPLHLHRIVPGCKGGKYELSNCVLVCIHHHRGIEGLNREQIQKFCFCTTAQYRTILRQKNRLGGRISETEKQKLELMEKRDRKLHELNFIQFTEMCKSVK